ncbi:hypothetical protein EQV77_12250 [Halobacillus fulvus]|nr:hypothetical protein EQV77_12250 [Halobacillus fulvus]
MKKRWMFCIVTTFLIMTGCTEFNDGETLQEDDVLPGNAMDQYNDSQTDGQVGYVRFQKNQLDENTERNREVKINREQMADMISRMILRYDGFDDVATLVTDYEVLVAYKAPDNRDRKEIADMVQKTAYSLVPSFYRVYVSDNPASFKDIQSVSTSTVYDDQYREVIDSMITKFKRSPQGTVKQNDDQMGNHMQDQS